MTTVARAISDSSLTTSRAAGLCANGFFSHTGKLKKYNVCGDIFRCRASPGPLQSTSLRDSTVGCVPGLRKVRKVLGLSIFSQVKPLTGCQGLRGPYFPEGKAALSEQCAFKEKFWVFLMIHFRHPFMGLGK